MGIFRNLTENDYGIDFEIELVKDGAVTGRYFKAQVKSAESIFVRQADGVPTVSGIKQTTLAYWSELSFRTHVVAFAVDLASENVFVSRPVFWQSTHLIDGSTKSKTIEFLPNATADAQQLVFDTVYAALSPSVPDIIYAHTAALRHLSGFFQLYVDVTHYDPGMELHQPEIFRTFLELCSILLWADGGRIDLPDDDKKRPYSFDHWARKGGAHSTEVTNYAARAPMHALMPLLIEVLRRYRDLVLRGAYFWSFRNPQVLGLVHKSTLPDTTDPATLTEWGYRFDQYSHPPVLDVSVLITQVRQKADELRNAEEQK